MDRLRLRRDMRTIKYNIPVPPSVNAMWCNSYNKSGKGRHKSASYKKWIDEAIILLNEQGIISVDGHIELDIFIARPSKKSDIDNRIKAIPDLLQRSNIIKNDNLINRIQIEWIDKEMQSYIILTIK